MTQQPFKPSGAGLSPAELKADLILIATIEDVGAMPQNPRLVEDLELDSLAMAEVVLLLENKYGLEKRRMDLLTRDWNNVTVSQLFEECCLLIESSAP
ncbi:MAG TPA: acyl carrier protein [Solirubrobacterales bacterium]|nr:acyl carrier protein [Solirubrobacterales bacterium]